MQSKTRQECYVAPSSVEVDLVSFDVLCMSASATTETYDYLDEQAW